MRKLHCDTLIIGAGVAGLAAGRALAEAGQQVLLVEARERIGGRILTQDAAGTGDRSTLPVELGAEFVHGLPDVTLNILSEARLATLEREGDTVSVVAGRLTAEAREQPAGSVLARMTHWLSQQPPGTDMPFAEYLRIAPVAPEQAGQAAAYVEGFNAADQHEIGIAALARQQQAEDAIQGERIFYVRRGYRAVPEFIAERFARAGGILLLGHRLRRIDWRPGHVHATLDVDSARTAPQESRVEVSAPRAVVTLPLGVLQAGSVTFEPSPRILREDATRLVMGTVQRASLVFRNAFWRDAQPNMSFLFVADATIPTWWTQWPDPAPILTAWVGGSTAAGTTLDLNTCLAELSAVFGRSVGELRRNLSSWHTHDWSGDEFARGAYSYAAAGGLDASSNMAQPVEQTLYFAGEHTDTQGHWGTVHAALSSGQRAAAQILGL